MFFIIIRHQISKQCQLYHLRVISLSIFRKFEHKFLYSFECRLILYFIFNFSHIIQSLNCRTIYFVIFAMCSYKTNKYKLKYIFYNDYKAVIVSLYIKNIMLVAYIIHTVECAFYISKTFPFRTLYYHYPFLQSGF